MYSALEYLLTQRGITPYRLSKEAGVTQTALSNWKSGRSVPSITTLKKIANYFDVPVDYFMSDGDAPVSPELTARDERDIAKTLDQLMEQIKNKKDGPLYYNGAELDDVSLELLRVAYEHALRETKKENKIKYNPYKNKSEKAGE